MEFNSGVTEARADPLDCNDDFNDAYYGRPEMLLDPKARLACSAWSLVEPSAIARSESRVAGALADGTWDQRHGYLRRLPSLRRTYAGSRKTIITQWDLSRCVRQKKAPTREAFWDI